MARTCAACEQPLSEDAHGSRKYCDDCRGNIAREHGRRKRSECSRCGRPVHKTRPKNGWTPPDEHICRPCRAVLAAASGRTRSGNKFTPTLRWCEECGEAFMPRTANQKYCRAECREAVRARRGFGFKAASATERGYGAEHKRERERWKPLVDRGGAWCCLCGEHIEPGSVWHLDHTPDRTGYRGVAHALCNVRDGASRAATKSNANRPVLTKVCGGCGATFTTTYPKQTYCSRECRPTRPTRTKPVPVPRNCIDCARPIKRGKRCRACAEAHARTYARNYYRTRVGIPLEAPKWDRTWRAA